MSQLTERIEAGLVAFGLVAVLVGTIGLVLWAAWTW